MTIHHQTNMIQRIGGERDFTFVINALVSRLRDDRKLATFFSAFTDNDLASHLEQFLKTVFVFAEEQQMRHTGSCTDDASRTGMMIVQNFIYIRFHRLFQQGFNERHFDLLAHHFVGSLQDAWIDDSRLIGDVMDIFGKVRPNFEEKIREKIFKGNKLSSSTKQQDTGVVIGTTGGFVAVSHQ